MGGGTTKAPEKTLVVRDALKREVTQVMEAIARSARRGGKKG